MREEVGGAFPTAALAGLVAAVAGGVAWGLIVRWSGYEVGFVAWGIGFLVGSAVALAAVWSAFDALWIGLAVVTAFRIPAVPREPAEEPVEPLP
jgi:hypothetical protein